MGSTIVLRPFNAKTDEEIKQRSYIGWSPVPLTLTGRNDAGEPNVVRLSSKSLTAAGVKLQFKTNALAQPRDEVEVDLGANGTAVCFVCGKFQEGAPHNGASADGKDVAIEAAWASQANEVKGRLKVMVRVRRNANEMSDTARADFTAALAELNGYGRGIYVTDFVAMHVGGAYNSLHGDTHFLPWHRLYLLDLERQLQLINPSVTLPYWRFDQPAPRVFDAEFMGATDHVRLGEIDPATGLPMNFTLGTSGGRLAAFSGANRLGDWKIGNTNGIERVAFFDPKSEFAPGWGSITMISEDKTLALGGDDNEFGFRRPPRGFARMEGQPHGSAHVSFNGAINDIGRSPEDPLFFLLHCNVDRLWAKWQFAFERDTPEELETYSHQTKRSSIHLTPSYMVDLLPDEHTLREELPWPWDDSWSKPHNLRPPGTRSRNFTKTRTGKEFDTNDNMPSLSDALDAFGHRPLGRSVPNTFTNYLGFSYDDVPFDHERANAHLSSATG